MESTCSSVRSRIFNTKEAMNRQMVQPRRPSSRQSVMSGSHSSLMSNNYMPMYPGQFMNQGYPGAVPSGLSRPATGSMTNINQAAMNPQGNSPEWADAMVKMEHCLAMLNQLQMGGQPTPQMMPTTNQQPMLRQIPPFRPTVNQVQRYEISFTFLEILRIDDAD